MNLGKNASYEDYAVLDESKYPRADEKIAEFWLKKYKESRKEPGLVHEDDNIKIVAEEKPIYCSGWSEGDDSTPGKNDVVLKVNVTVKNPIMTFNGHECNVYGDLKDGIYYLAVTFSQKYDYVETYSSRGSYWDPPESDGYYEPVGEVYIDDDGTEGPELFKTAEEAIKAVKLTGKEDLYKQPGVVTIDRGDSVFCNIGEPDYIMDWCDEAPVHDPSGVYDSYHQHMMDLEARAEEIRGKY